MNNTKDRKKNIRQSSRRPRGRHHNNNNGNNRNRSVSALRHQNFDSNGPEVRVRGNARQVYEKYQALARDAASAGDPVMAENYLQHAEHYYRITEAIEEAAQAEQRKRNEAVAAKQPEMPATYFTPEGKSVPKDSVEPKADKASVATTVKAEEKPKPKPRTRTKAAPKKEKASEPKEKAEPSSSPFFTLDETDDEMGSQPQKLVAQQ